MAEHELWIQARILEDRQESDDQYLMSEVLAARDRIAAEGRGK